MADVDAGAKTPVVRPLSPHLGIYRLSITMAMSILHRITGAALYVGTILVVWWLVALSTDSGAFTWVSAILGSIPGKLIMFGYTWALLHHMMGGIRHFVWDSGYGLDAPLRDRIAQATIAVSLGLTVIVWVLYLIVG